MVFSSITFLFFFLPFVLGLYLISGKRGSNILLLLASLLFYCWGEGAYCLIMVLSIIVNYLCGRLILVNPEKPSRTMVTIGVVFNLIILVFFKYANFFTDNINVLLQFASLPPVVLEPVHLPIGISFFTFQALSYLIDVYRKQVPVQTCLINLGLYISLFPQLIAGPIVRYQTVAKELTARVFSRADFADGIERFIFGLSKKVLLANPMAAAADHIFTMGTDQLTTPLAWLGAVCYLFQIYFDFSGYSDMAIGLGRMFGFHFLENFNYPYLSRSIQEFWRRWHISLSSWFRDYVYIPLGGNRKGQLRTHLNLITVFLLCGLWHGAYWTFLIWGLYHGLFLVLERGWYGRLIKRCWTPVQHGVCLLIVLVGWVIFRCETLGQTGFYLQVMFGFGETPEKAVLFTSVFNNKLATELLFATFLSAGFFPFLEKNAAKLKESTRLVVAGYGIRLILLCYLGYGSVISLAAGVYNPFIYFRF